MTAKQEEKSPPGRLHYQVTPQSVKLKQLLVAGFVKNIAQIVPSDITRLCAEFYDEVMYWKLDHNELKKYYKSKEIFTDIFEINDIKLKCSFYPNKTNEESVFYLHALLPKEIQQVNIYSEIFCTENDAHFRYVTTLKKPPSLFEYDAWLREEYVMYLKCEQFKCINLAVYFEILSVKYTLQKTVYLKPVFMKRKIGFTWNFDDVMIKQLRNAGTRQMFLSETFDEYNSNWGLSIVPMDYDVDDMDDRRIQLVLDLCKRPNIEELKVNCKVTNSYDNSVQMSTVTFSEDDEDSFRYLKELFPSNKLFKIDSLSITVEIELSVDTDSSIIA